MARKRYHQSRRDRRHEREGMHSRMSHESDVLGHGHMPDHFNDEWRHDRGNERALYRRFRHLGNEIYAGMEPRRRQEMEDAGYIHEDHDAIANLPQGVIMRPYPKYDDYMPEGLDDTIRGIDNQKGLDNHRREEHMLPKKY